MRLYVRVSARHISRNTDAIMRFNRGFMHMQFQILSSLLSGNTRHDISDYFPKV